MNNKNNIVIIVVSLVIIAVLVALNWTTNMDLGGRMMGYNDSAMSAPSQLSYSKTNVSAQNEMGMMDDFGYQPEEPRGGDTALTADQRIIRTGYLSLLVDEIAGSVPKISSIADTYKGFVQSSNYGEYPDGERYGSISIRVPADSYESAMSDIRGVAIRVVDESSNAQDVTEQYTDLQTRISVAQTEEQAYLALLDRSGSVSELLEVQRELANVRYNIESLQGQLKYLDNQTELSTITVSLQQDATISVPTKPYRFIAVVKDAFSGAINIAQGIVTFVVWVVIVGTIIGLPLLAIYLSGSKLWHKRKK